MQRSPFTRALWALLLGGCGAAAAVNVPAAGALSGGETLAVSAHPCLVVGDAEGMTVTVDGLPDLLTVRGLPAEVELPLGEHVDARARVLRPLAFTGRTAIRDLHVHVGVARSGDAISLAHGALIRALQTRAPGEAALEGTVVLEGGSEPDDHDWTGIALRTALRCEELALGEATTEALPRSPEISRMLVGDQDVVLFDAPGGAAIGVLRLHLGENHHLRGMHVTEERDGFAHLVQTFSWGAINGWIDAARLAAVPSGWGGEMTWGHGGGSGCGRSDHPYSYLGPARLRAGTEVTAEATGRVWAVVTEEVEADIGVRLHGGVEVIAVPGLESVQCGNLEFDLAMVPIEAVILP